MSKTKEHFVQVINAENQMKAIRFGFETRTEAEAFQSALAKLSEEHAISMITGIFKEGDKCPFEHLWNQK